MYLLCAILCLFANLGVATQFASDEPLTEQSTMVVIACSPRMWGSVLNDVVFNAGADIERNPNIPKEPLT